MKRNKRTRMLAHEELQPLTERILSQMGREGTAIRLRLLSFYRERAGGTLSGYEESLKNPG